MKRFDRISLVDGAVAEMSQEISSGRWPVGTRIPAESQLVEQLGMSRTPVREAIRSLVQSGLLMSRQGAGTFVVATDVTEVALRRRLQDADYQDVVQVRDGLDMATARLAAANRTAEDLLVLSDALARRAAAFKRQDALEFIDADTQFHVGVARATGNPVLHELYSTMAGVIGRALHSAFVIDDDSHADEDLHGALLTAIEDQDVPAATAAALNLLEHTREQAHDGS